MVDDLSTKFLKGMFGARWLDVLVCSFPESPAKKKFGWPVYKVGDLVKAGRWPLPVKNNNYFAVSLFSGSHRRAHEFVSLHVLAIDDVGTKASASEVLAKLGVPAWSWETSPGNQQWFYRFTPPVTDLATATAMGYFVKSDAKSVTRVMRLPVGTNTKAEYGGKFATRVISQAGDAPGGPGDLGDSDVLAMSRDVDAAGGIPGSGSSTSSRVGQNVIDLIGKDLIGGCLYRLGFVKGLIPSRLGVEITCPWEAEHTIKTDTGAAYFPETGGFQCHHGHCEQKTGMDLRRWLDEYLAQTGQPGVTEGLFDPVDDTSGPLYRDVVLDQNVFVETENKYLNRVSGRLVSVDGFNAMHRDGLYPWLTVTSKSQGKDKISVLTPHVWFTGTGRGRKVHEQTYWPGREFVFTEAGVSRVNLWTPAPRPCRGRQVSEDTVAPWLDLVDDICEAEGWDVADWVIDWFALVVSEPALKPGFHLVLQSEKHGIGKDVMLRAIKLALGDGNVSTPAAGTLGHNFNPFVESRLVSVTDLERNTRGHATTHDIYATIKPWTENASRMIEVRKMYQAPYRIPNVCAWVITSNEDGVLPLAPSDRRFLVIMSGLQPRPAGDPYFGKLVAWIDGAGWGLVSEYLRERWRVMPADRRAKLMGPAPMTPGKRAMIRAGEDPVTSWTRQQIEDGIWPDVMTPKDIQEAYEHAGQRVLRMVPLPQKWVPILTRLGAKQYRDRVTVRMPNGVTTRLWIIRCPSWLENATTKQITDAYLQPRQLFARLLIPY